MDKMSSKFNVKDKHARESECFWKTHMNSEDMPTVQYSRQNVELPQHSNGGDTKRSEKQKKE